MMFIDQMSAAAAASAPAKKIEVNSDPVHRTNVAALTPENDDQIKSVDWSRAAAPGTGFFELAPLLIRRFDTHPFAPLAFTSGLGWNLYMNKEYKFSDEQLMSYVKHLSSAKSIPKETIAKLIENIRYRVSNVNGEQAKRLILNKTFPFDKKEDAKFQCSTLVGVGEVYSIPSETLDGVKTQVKVMPPPSSKHHHPKKWNVESGNWDGLMGGGWPRVHHQNKTCECFCTSTKCWHLLCSVTQEDAHLVYAPLYAK